MRYIIAILALLLCCSTATRSYAQHTADTSSQEEKSCCAMGSCCTNNTTPAGVMTDHIHAKKEWMLSYTYMSMRMQDNRVGTKKVSDDTLFTQYMMVPEVMTMKMHMFMAMYGVTDRFTLMAMFGYTQYYMSMDMPYAMQMPGMDTAAVTMISKSSGFSDTRLYGLYNFSNNESTRIIGSLGVNIPTGSVRERGVTMLGSHERLPYDMQPGTGSFGILPDITCAHAVRKFSFGANAGADIKLDKNSLGYKQGNMYHATGWAGYQFFSFMSGSVRAEWIAVEKISGSDKEMEDPAYHLDPTTSTSNYGGTWGNMYAGLNFHADKPVLRNFTLQLEYGMPVYENLNGPQMSVHSNFIAGLLFMPR